MISSEIVHMIKPKTNNQKLKTYLIYYFKSAESMRFQITNALRIERLSEQAYIKNYYPTFFSLFFLANILYKLTLLLHQQPSPLTALAL